MNPKEAIKNRLPISEVKNSVLDFCSGQENIEIAINGEDGFPIVEKGYYKYEQGIHILMLVHVSRFINILKDGDTLSGMIYEKDGGGLKTAKRLYGKYKCVELQLTDSRLLEVAKNDAMYKKMINHGAKFFILELVEGIVQLSGDEVYKVDAEYNVEFSKYALNGKERFENSRKIIMEYEDREVIFNTIIENDNYYTLTSAKSNKVNYIKANGVCKFYDGLENHFSSEIEILPEEKVEEIFNKLKNTNNAFFKSTENLLALTFSKK